MPGLTEQEKQEIIRYLEADKPLPDKYRFLLFEDKREVELVWNGKTGEVCNVVLPFQTIEQVDEPRAKKDAKIQGDLFDPAIAWKPSSKRFPTCRKTSTRRRRPSPNNGPSARYRSTASCSQPSVCMGTCKASRASRCRRSRGLILWRLLRQKAVRGGADGA